MKKPNNIEINVSPKLADHRVVVDKKEVGSYNTIQEISEIVIEALGKNAKKIHIEEVGKDD
jgi:hypothetical protein